MKYKHPKSKPIEQGWSMEVRKYRQNHPELSFYECRKHILDVFEKEEHLSSSDRAWIEWKRKDLDKYLADKKDKKLVRLEIDAEDLDDLLNNL